MTTTAKTGKTAKRTGKRTLKTLNHRVSDAKGKRIAGKGPEKLEKLFSAEKQKALVAAFRGSMPDLKPSVDEYLRQKYAETDAENAR